MKHTLLYIIAVILLCGVTVSCKKEAKEEKQTLETVIMFFPFSGLEDEIRMNITCMKEAIEKRGGLDKTRIIVYRAFGQQSGTLYEIAYENNGCKDIAIADVNATFSTSDQTSNVVKMQSVLDKIKEYAPAKDYSMIIGCHGSAWIPAGTTLGSISRAINKGGQTTAFGTASASNQIDNATLVKALNNSGMHLNYLMFDACYMASVEAIYEYRSVCDNFIASQNEIMSYGIPYDHIGDDLLKHNFQNVVQKYYEFYCKYHAPYGSLSVVATRNLPALAALVKEINTKYLSTEASISDVQIMDGIRPTVFFDFMDYYNKFCTSEQALKDLEVALRNAVYYERHTSEFYTYFSNPDHRPIKQACGLDISQPTQNNTAKQLIQNTNWWRDTH